MTDALADLEALIRDRNLSGDARLEAAAGLLKLSRTRARTLLLELAGDEHEEEAVARRVGALLGRLYLEDGDPEAAPLYDFREAAYLGFDDEVAELKRREH